MTTTTQVLEHFARIVRTSSIETRAQALLQLLTSIVTVDAAAILRLEQNRVLRPMAVEGFARDTLGRRFKLDEHPRLNRILESNTPQHFRGDHDLPDLFTGSLDDAYDSSATHELVGFLIARDSVTWGILTLSTLAPRNFDALDHDCIKAFCSMAAEVLPKLQEQALWKTFRGPVRLMNLKPALPHDEIVGRSPCILKLKDELDIVSASDLTVLIQGETGVGKELVARYIQQRSARASGPFVHVNCGALPENIAESELFGHVKGAFTSAVRDRMGKFELADKGTIFLDEIGELPYSLQSKLLRTLQNGEIQRVGSERTFQVNTRVIAATNRNLAKMVQEGRFRADLYHRLSVYPVTVPPLRERGEDIVRLAGYFLELNRTKLGLQGVRLTRAAEKALMEYQWPGNVRELSHVLSRAAIRARAKLPAPSDMVLIDVPVLDLDLSYSVEASESEVPAQSVVDFKGAVDAYQRQLIENAWLANQKNWAATARALRMDRGNLFRLAKRLGLH